MKASKRRPPIHRRDFTLVKSLAESLVAYLTYHSRCGGSAVYSELLLYEPIRQVASHLGWKVSVEYPIESGGSKRRGDHQRIDFKLTFPGAPGCKPEFVVGLEVKFIKKRPVRATKTLDATKDAKKLKRFDTMIKRRRAAKRSSSFLLVVGRCPRAMRPKWLPKASASETFRAVTETAVIETSRTCFGAQVFSCR